MITEVIEYIELFLGAKCQGKGNILILDFDGWKSSHLVRSEDSAIANAVRITNEVKK